MGTVGEPATRVKPRLEDARNRPYPQGMTNTLAAAVTAVTGVLDTIGDPIERFEASRRAEAALDDELRGVRQRIALELKRKNGKTWREVGEIMGGVSAQRAEQISRGK